MSAATQLSDTRIFLLIFSENIGIFSQIQS